MGVVLPGVVGNHLSVPDAPELDITGDIDVRFWGAVASWTAGNQTYVAKFQSSPQLSWALISNNGGVRWFISTTGSNFPFTNTFTFPLRFGEYGGIRLTWSTSSGLARLWVDRGEGWVIVDEQSGFGVGTPMFSGTSVLSIGANGSGSNPLTGTVNRVEVWAGTERRFAFHPVDLLGVDPNAATFQSMSGHTVTVHRSGSPGTLLVPTVLTNSGCPTPVPVASGPADRSSMLVSCSSGEC